MNKLKKTLKISLILSTTILSGASYAIDWSGVPVTKIPVYYAGQTGMEWILNKREHDGAARYKKRKKPCLECHEGDEVSFGPNQVKGKTDVSPYPDRRATGIIETQAAYDSNNFYLRLKWPKVGAAGKSMDNKFDTKITVMLDDGGVEDFAQGGCWTVCHQDSIGMPKDNNQKIKKYLSNSRKKIVKKVGGGINYKSDADIKTMLNSGEYLEFWQAQLNLGKPASFIDGYILKDRMINKKTVVAGSSKEVGNDWVVEFVRPLAGSTEHKTLAEGKKYHIGIALHDQNSKGRYHIVSFEYSLTLGGDSLIKAIKK